VRHRNLGMFILCNVIDLGSTECEIFLCSNGLESKTSEHQRFRNTTVKYNRTGTA
jgi:hypothetical protein